MARTKASSKASKENKTTPAANVSKGKGSKTRTSAQKPLAGTDANTADASSTNEAAPPTRGRRAKQTTAGSSLALQHVDTNVGEAGGDQAPSTAISEDLAAANAALKEELQRSKEQLAASNATLMRIKAWEDVKPRSDQLIPEPKVKPYSLITEMRLNNNKLLYNACRAVVRETVKAKFQVYQNDWRKQDPDFIANARTLIEKRQPVLKNYERGWATLAMMKTYMKGKRGYSALLTKLEAEHYSAAEKVFGGINLSASRQPVPFVPDSDEEDNITAPVLKTKAGKSNKKNAVVVEDDEEEEEAVAEKRKARGRKSAQVIESSSEEEEVAVKPKGRGRKRTRAVESSSEDDSASDPEIASDSDEEQAPIKAKTVKKTKKTKKTKEQSDKAPNAKKARI